jgi:hypothetical protein
MLQFPRVALGSLPAVAEQFGVHRNLCAIICGVPVLERLVRRVFPRLKFREASPPLFDEVIHLSHECEEPIGVSFKGCQLAQLQPILSDSPLHFFKTARAWR